MSHPRRLSLLGLAALLSVAACDRGAPGPDAAPQTEPGTTPAQVPPGVGGSGSPIGADTSLTQPSTTAGTQAPAGSGTEVHADSGGGGGH